MDNLNGLDLDSEQSPLSSGPLSPRLPEVAMSVIAL